MFNLRMFISDCKKALAFNYTDHNKQLQIEELFRNAAKERAAVLKTLNDKIPWNGGAYILEQSREIFLSIFAMPSMMRTATHDHGLWTTIMILHGDSQCCIYERHGNRISNPTNFTYKAGDVFTLSGDTPHDEANPTKELTIEIHFYPGEVMKIDSQRRLWHPLTLRSEPYNMNRYQAITEEASRSYKKSLTKFPPLYRVYDTYRISITKLKWIKVNFIVTIRFTKFFTIFKK